MGLGRTVLRWLDKLDEVTLGRLGMLPVQVAARRKGRPHSYWWILGAFAFAFALNLFIKRAGLDQPWDEALLSAFIVALGPPIGVGLAIWIRRRSSGAPHPPPRDGGRMHGSEA